MGAGSFFVLGARETEYSLLERSATCRRFGSSFLYSLFFRVSGAVSTVLGIGRVLNICGQATKGTWGMSWCWKALKGVEDCEKPGGVVKRTLIPGFLN